jgi:CBS domain-containing protein
MCRLRATAGRRGFDSCTDPARTTRRFQQTEETKMGKVIRDIMTDRQLIIVSATDSIAVAARKMRDHDIGDVLVEDGGKLCGIITDRDIVVRALAEGMDASSTACKRICSEHLTTLSPDDDVDNAVTLMKKKAIRRIPILENGKAVGMLSIGDLAVERDPNSALAGISAAAPNT